ncbi:MAG: prolyl oligopeptidase family serine peptidase [Acidobacteriaceae bacterium]|jgi:prolyl oligopeptidase
MVDSRARFASITFVIVGILVTTAFNIGCRSAATAAVSPSSVEQVDKYQWLEDVTGERSLTWVRAQNARSANVLEGDPRFPELKEAALKVLESPDRLAIPRLQEGMVYNTWRDAEHVHGIFRRTTLSDYLTPQPHWQTVIDYDALAKQDKQEWVPNGLDCLYPGNGLCLVALSAGGEDAQTLREFDLKTARFVEHGFVSPHSKQDVAWIDKNSLLIARDWGAGTMTRSGYPFVIKLWKRGQSLEQAKEVFRATENDVGAAPESLDDSRGHHVALLQRDVNTFESEYSLWTPAGHRKLSLPGKVEVEGLLDNQLIVTLNEDWKPDGLDNTFPQGSVVSLDMAAVRKDPEHLRPAVIFTPSQVEFAQEVRTTRNHLVLTTLEHVQGRAYIYTRSATGEWTRKKLDLPANQTVDIVPGKGSDDRFFLRVQGFLTPSSLLLGDPPTNSLKTVKSLPPQFDASHEVVEQLEATSKDGTKVPYFVVHRKDMKYNGANPTLLTAYGGFQVSNTPTYRGTIGKLWLERGGVYVLANIRGGGEFGPAWHEAGLKTHRQRIYDDFAAVGQDLVTRQITSPRRLGISGDSNGGLLVGVEFTQHPEMWDAVIIGVPLLDMLRFEQIAAGASWVGEYGSVSVPAERAFLASISPYNQLRPNVNYPEPLIFTTTKDDRVGPVHARKFAARMEEFNKPFFYYEIIEGGHNTGANLKEAAQTEAVDYIYLTRKLMD